MGIILLHSAFKHIMYSFAVCILSSIFRYSLHSFSLSLILLHHSLTHSNSLTHTPAHTHTLFLISLLPQIGGKAAKAVVTTIEAHLEKAVDFIRYECKENVATSNNQLTAELLNLFEGQLRGEEDPKVRPIYFVCIY